MFIGSLSLTGPPDEWKPFPSKIWRLPPVSSILCLDGSHGLACQPVPHQTVARSSHLPHGMVCAANLGYNTFSPQPTIHKPTTWWRGCIGKSMTLCEHVQRVRHGTVTYPGCCWAYVLHLRRPLVCLWWRWCLVARFSFLESCSILPHQHILLQVLHSLFATTLEGP
jgi:hypothetical protein